MSILGRVLQSLSKVGVREAILVVGYRGDQVRRFAGQDYDGVKIRYVVNDRHAETNTAYSLWLAKRYLSTDCLLIEGDILVDVAALKRIFDCSPNESVWTAIPVAPGNDEGILLAHNIAGYVTSARLVAESDSNVPPLSYKCAGIQLLTRTMARALAANLDEVIANVQLRTYADQVLAEMLTENSMKLCSLEGLRWAEVDDLKDFIRARQLFTVSASPGVLSPREVSDQDLTV